MGTWRGQLRHRRTYLEQGSRGHLECPEPPEEVSHFFHIHSQGGLCGPNVVEDERVTKSSKNDMALSEEFIDEAVQIRSWDEGGAQRRTNEHDWVVSAHLYKVTLSLP